MWITLFPDCVHSFSVPPCRWISEEVASLLPRLLGVSISYVSCLPPVADLSPERPEGATLTSTDLVDPRDV